MNECADENQLHPREPNCFHRNTICMQRHLNEWNHSGRSLSLISMTNRLVGQQVQRVVDTRSSSPSHLAFNPTTRSNHSHIDLLTEGIDFVG